MDKQILKTLLVELVIPFLVVTMFTAGFVSYELDKEKREADSKKMREVPIRITPNTV